MEAILFALGFGFLGYFMRKSGLSPLPFVIACILGGSLEQTARQAFAATGGDPFFLFKSPIAARFRLGAVTVIIFAARQPFT